MVKMPAKEEKMPAKEEKLRQRISSLKFEKSLLSDAYFQLKDTLSKLKESEEKYRSMMELAPDGIISVDMKGIVISCNLAFLRLTGYPKEHIVGRHFSKLPTLHMLDMPKYMKLLSSIVGGNIPEPVEFEWTQKDGSVHLGEIRMGMIKTGNRVTGMQAFLKDITERKQAEESLRESEERHRILYESSWDAIMTLAPPSWTFTSGNPATVKLFGAKNEKEFTSKGPGELSPECQPDGTPSSVKAKKMIEKAMKEGSNFFEWTHKRISGEDFPATVLLTRVKLKDKTFLQATVRDVTAQKKAEEELKSKIEELERFNRLAVGRELKMIELKKRIKELESQVRKK
ncbi:MAG: PAS domain S-box protein [Candidatus Aenigmarchaeota archaeon]|nr:PAS domain S-box protein [Candidatus Aenigmarchaeota archaeon]